MTDMPPIVASDPDAPQAIELGEDGDFVVTNTLDPAVAELVIRAHVDQYDEATRAEMLRKLDATGLYSPSYFPGTWWWKAESHVDGAELVDIATELPPTPFRGVVVTLDWTE